MPLRGVASPDLPGSRRPPPHPPHRPLALILLPLISRCSLPPDILLGQERCFPGCLLLPTVDSGPGGGCHSSCPLLEPQPCYQHTAGAQYLSAGPPLQVPGGAAVLGSWPRQPLPLNAPESQSYHGGRTGCSLSVEVGVTCARGSQAGLT